jgi:uncharacterized protein YbaP (TraB family)
MLAGLLLLGLGSDEVRAADSSSLYWVVKSRGAPAGYLLGTIHSEDPRVLDFSESFVEQMAGNEIFAMEMVPDLPTLTRLTEYLHYADGTRLEDHIGPKRLDRVRAALGAYRVPPDWIDRMKVWAVMMTLSVPPPKTGLFMDFSLSLRAAGAGLKVVGLETLEEQLSFLEDMPLEQQLNLLDQALDEHHQVLAIHDLMVDSYLAGDLRALESRVDEQLAELPPEARQYFLDQGIGARNRRMLSTLLPLLAERRVFIAVGALHLPGENGLIELLRREGYELDPLRLPFSASRGGSESEQQGDYKTGETPPGLHEHGGHTQYTEQQGRRNPVADALRDGRVTAGHQQQEMVGAELAGAVKHERQQHQHEQ